MNYVEPIRDKVLLSQILAHLEQTSHRNYMMFLIGVNTALRISDILPLTYEDICKDKLYIKEKKTGKVREIPLNPILKAEAKKVPKEQLKEFIFKSRQGNGPIGRGQAYNIIKSVGKKFKIENVGTHTLRKTYGYHFYQLRKDIYSLMKILNHTKQDTTLLYIGVNTEMVEKAQREFSLK